MFVCTSALARARWSGASSCSGPTGPESAGTTFTPTRWSCFDKVRENQGNPIPLPVALADTGHRRDLRNVQRHLRLLIAPYPYARPGHDSPERSQARRVLRSITMGTVISIRVLRCSTVVSVIPLRLGASA